MSADYEVKELTDSEWFITHFVCALRIARFEIILRENEQAPNSPTAERVARILSHMEMYSASRNSTPALRGLGLEEAYDLAQEVMLTRIPKDTSKLDSLCDLAEAGIMRGPSSRHYVVE